MNEQVERKKSDIHDHKNKNKAKYLTYILGKKEKYPMINPLRSVISFKFVLYFFLSTVPCMYGSRTTL